MLRQRTILGRLLIILSRWKEQCTSPQNDVVRAGPLLYCGANIHAVLLTVGKSFTANFAHSAIRRVDGVVGHEWAGFFAGTVVGCVGIAVDLDDLTRKCSAEAYDQTLLAKY